MGEAVVREIAMTMALIITKTTSRAGRVKTTVKLAIIVIETNSFQAINTKTILTKISNITKDTITIIKEISEIRITKETISTGNIIKEITTNTTKGLITRTTSTITTTTIITTLHLEEIVKEIKIILIIKHKLTIAIEETSIMAKIGKEEDKITTMLTSIIGEITTTIKIINNTIKAKMNPTKLIINNKGNNNSNNFKTHRIIEISRATITLISKETIEGLLKITTIIGTSIIIAITIKISAEIVEI